MKRKRIASEGPHIFMPDADDSRSFPVPAISLTGERVNLRCRFASNSRVDPTKRWVDPEPEVRPLPEYHAQPLPPDPYKLGGGSDEERVAVIQQLTNREVA